MSSIPAFWTNLISRNQDTVPDRSLSGQRAAPAGPRRARKAKASTVGPNAAGARSALGPHHASTR
jgi:hypothetical protein